MPVFPNYIPRILIIDDEPFNREFLELILRQQGYKTSTASNSRKGIELAEKLQPDMILLDIMMPGETGYECATILRLSPETSEIPIVFLTALDDAKSEMKGFDAGAVDFITKPFEYREILHRIRLLLRIAESDKLAMQYSPHILRAKTFLKNEESPSHDKKHSTFPSVPAESVSYIHEIVIMPNQSESHLLLNFTNPQLDNDTINTIRKALSLYSGPLYTPSETFRNAGVALIESLKPKTSGTIEIDGIFAHINRETDSMTLVNAGAFPAIFMNRDGITTFIEPQSGLIGEIGRGLLPCSTFEMKKRSRLFMYSKEMISAFTSTGEAIKTLKEACELSAGVDLDTACQAAGEMLQKGKAMPDGILVAVEA